MCETWLQKAIFTWLLNPEYVKNGYSDISYFKPILILKDTTDMSSNASDSVGSFVVSTLPGCLVFCKQFPKKSGFVNLLRVFLVKLRKSKWLTVPIHLGPVL